jgi:hypothetical protein
MAKLKILIAFLLVTGCRAHYQSPSSNNTVILHIHNITDHRLSAYRFKNPEYCSGGVEIISSASILPQDEIQIRIIADEYFSFLTDWISPGPFSEVANLPVTFLPRAEREYDFYFQVSGTKYGGYMTYRGSYGPVPDPTFRIRERKPALLPGDSFCK